MFFFFNDTATTEIYTLSLHDALPISRQPHHDGAPRQRTRRRGPGRGGLRHPEILVARRRRSRASRPLPARSEEHTSELQSQSNLVCRLLLEKKKMTIYYLDGKTAVMQ